MPEEADGNTEPKVDATVLVWVDAEGDLTTATLSYDSDGLTVKDYEWDLVHAAGVGGSLEVTFAGDPPTMRRFCARPGQPTGFHIGNGGDLAISWDGQVRLVYAAGQWLDVIVLTSNKD